MFISTAAYADNAVNLFEKDYKLSHSINELHTVTIDEATGIFIVDKGINLDGKTPSADTFKIINGRILLINKSNKLNPTL